MITDAGLVHLSGLHRLERLNLRECFQLTDAGLVHLSICINLSTLVSALVSNSAILGCDIYLASIALSTSSLAMLALPNSPILGCDIYLASINLSTSVLATGEDSPVLD
eukprot:g23014.t1